MEVNAALVVGFYLVWLTTCSKISSDCLSLMGSCISSDLCRSEQTLLSNVCDTEDGRCPMQSSEGCNVTIQTIISHSPLWRECVCVGEDPCSTLMLMASLCQSSSGHENKKVKTEWKGSRLIRYVPGQSSSCLQETTLCIQDEVCNRQLVPFVQACSGPQCEDERCRAATRHFYSGLPQNVAEMLVFCQCERGDQDCQQVQATLHSNSCLGNHVQPWNCLEMLDSCSEDELCRPTFEAFLSKCFGPEHVTYSEYSTRDILHVVDLDFFQSGDKECQKAFVATMGSLLQSPCTCHGLPHHNLDRCNMLQQAIQNRSHYRFQAAKRNVSCTWSQVNKSGRSHLRFNDQLWYFLMYVFVVVVILIAVAVGLHKLGGMRSLKPRLNPPHDSTKAFVL